MRELDVREATREPGSGRERRGPRWSAGPVRCAGATRAEVNGVDANRAEVSGAGTSHTELNGAGGSRAETVGAGASGVGPAAAGARPVAVGVARRRRFRRPAVDVASGASPRSTGPLAEQLCPTGPAPAPARPTRAPVPAVGGARRGDGRPVGAGPAVVPPRTVRPTARRCVAPARRRSLRPRVRSAGERFLVGAATVFCSAAVVVLLGLLGDAAAGWNAGPAEPVGAAPVATETAGR